jgi:stage II sporulation protein D
MEKPPRIQKKYTIILIFAFLIFWSIPVEFGQEKTFFQGYLIEKPIIRVRLGVNLSNIKIRSSSGMKIYEVKSSYKLIADDVDEVRIKGHKEKVSERFIIQVGQAREREEAEAIAQDLRTEIENKVYVSENEENGTFQIKVGDFLTRGAALDFIKILHQIGIKDTWILREEITEKAAKPLWILVNDELKGLNDETVLYFIPSNQQSFLSFKGRNYRGIFVLKGSSSGLVLVNILNIEDYLKGVVPSEYSPYHFHELEAHKAQAVAARTYAIKNLESSEELGYDLCDTPKSQFYRGMNAEHPFSSQAVEETRGEVVLYRGKLINALYTSTCGGMTENVENVFEGKPSPYLKSTECVYERQKEWHLKGKNIFLPIKVKRRNISREIAYLISWGIIPPEQNPAFYSKEGSFKEAVEWIQKAVVLVGKQKGVLAPENKILNFITLANLIIDALGWQDRVKNLLLEREVDYLLKDFKELKENDRNNLAYLISAGILPASEDMEDPKRRLNRAEIAFYVAQVISNHSDMSNHGVFKGFDKDKIVMEKESQSIHLTLAPKVFLLKNSEGQHSFPSQLYLLGGEDVRWIEKEGEVQLLEIITPLMTNTLDRYSALHRWQERKSREKLEREINQYYPIGKLIDIIAQKRGVSGRVIKLLIKGSEGEVVAVGLKIRYVLGLKETFFVIDREYDEEGQVSYFTFTGKGWGHGVGLCQVGAYGMAQAGADYKEILKKYYRGIKIEKIY